MSHVVTNTTVYKHAHLIQNINPLLYLHKPLDVGGKLRESY